MMRNLHCLITALAYCSLTFGSNDRGDDGAAVKTVTTNYGEPLILNFGYSSPTIGVSYDMTLDRKEISVDNYTRIFKQLDKIINYVLLKSTSMILENSYCLIVIKDGVDFENKLFSLVSIMFITVWYQRCMMVTGDASICNAAYLLQNRPE